MACIPEPGLYGADLRVCDSARLIALMLRLLPQPGQFDAGIGGLTLFRYDAPQDVTCFTEPSVGLVVQGCKESLLGTELLRYGVEDLGLRTIWCDHYDGNQKSKRVIRKSGFTFRFLRMQKVPTYDNATRLALCYAMTREEWQKRREEGNFHD